MNTFRRILVAESCKNQMKDYESIIHYKNISIKKFEELSAITSTVIITWSKHHTMTIYQIRK